jgi:hypothetical protein
MTTDEFEGLWLVCYDHHDRTYGHLRVDTWLRDNWKNYDEGISRGEEELLGKVLVHPTSILGVFDTETDAVNRLREIQGGKRGP